MTGACLDALDLSAKQDRSDQVQLQKRQTLAAFDDALRHVADSVAQLHHTRQMMARLDPSPSYAVEQPPTIPSAQFESYSPGACLRLQNEVLSLKAEIDAMRRSHDAITDCLRAQLHAANSARLIAEANLRHLQAAVHQTERSIQASLQDLTLATGPLAAASTAAAGGSQVLPTASADDVVPEQAAPTPEPVRRPQPIDGHCLQRLLSAKTVTDADQIVDALARKALPLDDAVRILVDVIVDDDKGAEFVALILSSVSLETVRDRVIVALFDRIVTAAPDRRLLIHAACLICRSCSQLEPLRVLLFDLLRLRSSLDLDLIAIVIQTSPSLLDTPSSTLCQAMIAIVCDALHQLPDSHPTKAVLITNPFWRRSYQEHDPHRFATIATSAIDAVSAFDQAVDGIRALELIALSRGWLWSCSFIIGPLWERLSRCSSPERLAQLITAIAVVGRTSFTDSAADSGFLQALVSRLHTFLDKAFPGQVQIAAVNALVLLSNGRLSGVRDVYTWFVTAPDTIRTRIPILLRDDLTFIAKQLSVR